jgi:glutamate racemase
MAHRAAIGIFDSGIGGLTVAAEFSRQLENEDLIYLGDTARLPYGTRSPKTVARYAERAAGALLKYPIKALVVACNTASAYALDHLKAATDVPVLGVIQPGARAAVSAPHGGKIGIAGTAGTIASGAYQNAIRAQDPNVETVQMPWPLLVSLAEEGWIDNRVARLTLATYLDTFVEAEVGALVLGCTHYPVFKNTIQEVLASDFSGVQIALIDSAEAVTEELRALLQENDLEAPHRAGRRSFFCTDAADRFKRVGSTFLGEDLASVTTIDL